MTDQQRRGAASFQKKDERVEDMHLALSEKYMAYKDLADRCLINTQNINKGDKRVFYMRPQNIFLEEPKIQNEYRSDMIKMLSSAPLPEPQTLFADDLHKFLLEHIQDKSHPSNTRQELSTFFKRRQYKLQHKKYKLLQRWSHYALTSELVDKVSLKFSPNYSKIQFELENSVKRSQRLEGEDHFLNIKRPQATQAGMTYKEDKLFAASCLRIDDLDVYMRVTTYEEKINKDAETFIHNVKWLPMSQRFEIFKESIEYFQSLRKESLDYQTQRIEKLKIKGKEIIEGRKLDSVAEKELNQIVNVQHINKQQKKLQNMRDQLLNTSKYNYEVPQIIAWNEIELKVQLQERMNYFGVQGDLEIDFGHSFAYNIMVFFPTFFQTQVIKSQFAVYDALPEQIDTQSLARENIKITLDRNQKRYGKSLGKSILNDFLKQQREENLEQTEFLNSIEKALFGEFNKGQLKEFPQVRIKKSWWVIYQCYKPVLSNDQLFQASILGSENNNIDECLRQSLDLLNVNDVKNVNLVLDSISSMHHDKIKFGQIRTDFLLKYGAFLFPKEFQKKEYVEEDIYSEQEKNFLSVFMGCLRTKSEFDSNKDIQDISPQSLLNIPQHLLFALYILKYLKARESKIKLLYTLNVFRTIQKRLTLELKEMGTRDRIMGDAIVIQPLENKKKIQEIQNEPSQRLKTGNKSSKTGTSFYKGETQSAYSKAFASKEDSLESEEFETLDIINVQVVDLMKIKFKDKFKNLIFSTCPILPRYHQTFGEPIERQEISAEIENSKVADTKKEEGKKLLGRVDEIIYNPKVDTYFVKDDFGEHIMYESTFLDMKSLEKEIIKICSYYIGKQEPCLDQDLKNIYPSVCRFGILEQIFDLELQYQNAKVELVLCYMECFDHICDLLEQQRMVQIIVDLMAERPKLNLNGTHFKDSYKAEIERLKLLKQILREVMRMQMRKEFKENNTIREYLEKTYMVVMDQGDGKWNYSKPENLEAEIKNRETFQKGVQEEVKSPGLKRIADQRTSLIGPEEQEIELEKKKDVQIFNAKFSDPKEFAAYLGIPFASLQMLMRDYKERDPMVKQSIHEHVSFIKIEEGYPIFIYNMANKLNNTFKVSKDSERIGILDFYESLQIMTKIAATIKASSKELNDVHKPDNGLLQSCLEVSTLRYILAELKMIKEKRKVINVENSINYIEDDSIIGNPERMLFYAKEFSASENDEMSSHNPYVISKLNLNSIRNFQFEEFQKLLQEEKQYATSLSTTENKEFNLRRKLTTHHVYRYFPQLKQRAQKIFIPSMLKLTCNSVELLRLRQTLVDTLNQTFILEKVYNKQINLMAKEGKIYFKDPMNFQTFVNLGGGEFINFIDEGPSTGIDINLAINEFDPTMRSHINFSDPEAFKAMICPLGLEELRVVVLYQLMNLQALIVGTRTNQLLLDSQLRVLSELEFFSNGITVANPSFDVFNKLSGQNLIDTSQYTLKKIYSSEKSHITAVIANQPGSLYYNVISRKNRIKPNIEKTFQKIRQQVADESKKEKQEILLRQLRTLRAAMCQDYCMEILSEVYSDAIKLQLMIQVDQLRRRQYLLPKESQFMIMPNPQYGEYFTQYNNKEEDNIRGSKEFFNNREHKINNMFQLPLFNEILEQESPLEYLKEQNLPNLYNYNISFNNENLPHLTKNSQERLLKSRLPKLEFVNPSDFDQVISQKKRLVEFKNAFSFEQTRIFQIQSYFKAMQNLYDLEFFQNKIGSNAHSIASIENNVLSGLPYWEEGQEEILQGLSDYSSEEDMPQNLKNKKFLVADMGQKNKLTKAVVFKMAEEKKLKMRLMQQLESIKDNFNQLDKIMEKLELNSNLAKAVEFLNMQVEISFYGILQSLGRIQDNYYQEGIGKKEIQFINNAITKLSHLDDIKLTYTNGFHVNSAITSQDKINIEENSYHSDYHNFFLAAQPIIDEKSLSPQALTLISGIFAQDNINKKCNKKNALYHGQVILRDFEFLDYTLVNLSSDIRRYLQNNFQSIDNSLKDFILAKHKTEESTFYSNQNLYFEVLNDKRQYLKSMIKSRQLKRIYMMIMSENTLPFDPEQYKKLSLQYHDEINWKINLKLDLIQSNKQQNQVVKKQNEDISQSQIVQSMKKQNSIVSGALVTLEKSQVEIEVLSNEIQKFLLNTSFRLIHQETTSLAKAFELNGRLDFYIHPCQQFASTPNQNIDKRHHLDPINKVSAAQKFLTQVKNRSLEVETITSGTGIIISLKDLNDCLIELCRNLIKHGEIEMRSRCETFALQQVQFENMLYVKDQQLLNLDGKLKHAKSELDKIITTKVFAKGNQMIFELDFTTRQLRIMKDNVFTLEKKLQDKVRLTYDKDLDEARMKIDEYRKKFLDYSANVNARVIADVRENCNNIDSTMKQKADAYKDLTKQTPQNVNNNTIINIKNLNIGSDASQFDNDVLRVVKDYDKLKMNEKEARLEIVKLQTTIRKQRFWYRMKEVLQKQKHDFRIDNLKSQLTSNACLWEQLGESERRENILKQELIKSQQEIATQEKIIERLKDDLKKERGENEKLEQYKQTKAKRLEELEGKAREFEVMSSISLPKLLNLLEVKEGQLVDLKTKERIFDIQMGQFYKLKDQEMTVMKKKAALEQNVKDEALAKLENMRTELHMMEGQDRGAIDVWKDKCKQLIDICRSFKEENEKLTLHMNLLQSDMNSLQNTERKQGTAELQEVLRQQKLNMATQARSINQIVEKEDQRIDSKVRRYSSQQPVSIHSTQKKDSVPTKISDGNISSRTKIKKDALTQQLRQAQQQDFLYKSIDQAILNQHMNHSIVLGPTSKIQQNLMLSNEKEREALSLPKITKTTQQLSQLRGNNVTDFQIVQNRKPGGNIFSAKEEESPIKPSIQIKFEGESQRSSNIDQMTPMYDSQQQLQLKYYQNSQYKKNEESKKAQENVFSTLQRSSYGSLQRKDDRTIGYATTSIGNASSKIRQGDLNKSNVDSHIGYINQQWNPNSRNINIQNLAQTETGLGGVRGQQMGIESSQPLIISLPNSNKKNILNNSTTKPIKHQQISPPNILNKDIEVIGLRKNSDKPESQKQDLS